MATVDPATGNNNFFHPLITYDPILAAPVIPPRIYFDHEELQMIKIGIIELPSNTTIEEDSSGDSFIKILPVDDGKKYESWMTIPLGKADIDKSYHELYDFVKTTRTREPLTGKIPAHWNYYGTMSFSFDDVTVRSIAVPDHVSQEKVIPCSSPDFPEKFTSLASSSLSMKNERGRNTGVMVDVLPTEALLAQVFCDTLHLSDGHSEFFRGKPDKMLLRFLNLKRVVNLNSSMAGSGYFFGVIEKPGNSLDKRDLIYDFFEEYSSRHDEVDGVFIRFNLFEVQQNLKPDYEKLGKRSNPTRCKVIGSISPWFANEPRTIGMGRQLSPVSEIDEEKKQAPFVCRIGEGSHISLDILGSIPQWYDSETQSWETHDFGELIFAINNEGKSQEIASPLSVNKQSIPTQHLEMTGGILQLPLLPNLNQNDLATGLLELHLRDSESEAGGTLIMKETDFMLATDQCGIYSERTDEIPIGFNSRNGELEKVLFHIYEKGIKATDEFPVTVFQISKTGFNNAAITTFEEITHLHAGSEVTFPGNIPGSFVYLIIPGPHSELDHTVVEEMTRTGFFINHRVLPDLQYAKEKGLQPQVHSPKFSDVYEHILETYALVYPWSAIITPFEENYFSKHAEMIKQRMSLANWDSFTYMPTSRDLPSWKRLLFSNWVKQIQKS